MASFLLRASLIDNPFALVSFELVSSLGFDSFLGAVLGVEVDTGAATTGADTGIAGADTGAATGAALFSLSFPSDFHFLTLFGIEAVASPCFFIS